VLKTRKRGAWRPLSWWVEKRRSGYSLANVHSPSMFR
jgi:hypothetical protein